MDQAIAGFLLIDKPSGWTSFDVVAKLRRITGVHTIGHTGTLDPFATGLLVVAIGRGATKGMQEWMKHDKEYLATVTLGATSTTDDPEGTLSQYPQHALISPPPLAHIVDLLPSFTGPLLQTPPAFSAIKRGGVRLYAAARAGKPIAVEPRPVVVHALDLVSYEWPTLTIHLACGSGFYVRALARDLGAALGVGGYCSALRRTHVGEYTIERAVTIDTLTSENWQNYLLPVPTHERRS